MNSSIWLSSLTPGLKTLKMANLQDIDRLSLVFTSDISISISKMTKDKFSSEVYEDKAGRISFELAFVLP